MGNVPIILGPLNWSKIWNHVYNLPLHLLHTFYTTERKNVCEKDRGEREREKGEGLKSNEFDWNGKAGAKKSSLSNLWVIIMPPNSISFRLQFNPWQFHFGCKEKNKKHSCIKYKTCWRYLNWLCLLHQDNWNIW